MITSTMTGTANLADAKLVAESLGGNRDAFGRIVARYQSLICSLAYSATGSLGQSEDLAQETFITAWKHLSHLRERDKLRAWLCGIARNRINNSLRRDGREPLREAESLDAAENFPAIEPLPHDQTISKEEETILWRSLERIPEIYREPLVLFYREHQSVETVAANLDLTEDAVKQRLSRGRKMLQEQVLAFVEGALARTNPGKTFTVAVLAALPALLATSAKAATLGAATKGALAAKTVTASGMFANLLGPLMGFLGPWIQFRMLLKTAPSEEARAVIKSYYRKIFASAFVYCGALVLISCFRWPLIHAHPAWFAGLLMGLTLTFVAALLILSIKFNRECRKFKLGGTNAWNQSAFGVGWEYRSRFEFLGLPLVHIRLNSRPDPATGKRIPVKAWIAAGDIAYGGLFAFGGMAIAPISLGGVGIGLISWGGLALGVFVLGGIAAGVWVFGGIAMGWQAFGGCALAWHSAMGGFAMAKEFALGGVAHALQANNPAASEFVKTNAFFRIAEIGSRHIYWMNLFWLLPLAGWWAALARQKNNSSGGAPEKT